MQHMDWNLEQIERVAKASHSMTPTIKNHLKQLDKNQEDAHLVLYNANDCGRQQTGSVEMASYQPLLVAEVKDIK